ncbi:MAG: glycosyltransferase [Planctomycetota bacterium]
MGEAREPAALSIVAAAHNEQDNVRRLVEEVHTAMDPTALEYELIVVDDGSTDRTQELLQQMLPDHPRLRVIRMLDAPGISGRGSGQSAAFHAGVRADRLHRRRLPERPGRHWAHGRTDFRRPGGHGAG